MLSIPASQIGSSSVANVKVGLSIRGRHYKGSATTLGAFFSVNVNPCMRFYEKQSGQGYNRLDLEYQRGSKDFVFEYEVADCGAMRFDPNSLEFSLLQAEQAPFRVDAATVSQNNVTMPASYLQFVAVNQPFYLICSGTFRSSDGSVQQKLSIVFELRWLTQLALPVAEYKVGVAFGGDLTLDGSAAKMINTDSSYPRSYNVSWSWVCPKCFNCQNMATADGKLVMKNIML